jgi:hypothetical protein
VQPAARRYLACNLRPEPGEKSLIDCNLNIAVWTQLEADPVHGHSGLSDGCVISDSNLQLTCQLVPPHPPQCVETAAPAADPRPLQ